MYIQGREDETACVFHLWWAFRSRVLSLIQLVPALHQFDDHGVAEVDQLEACDVGSTMHEALQVDVLKTLQGERAVMGPVFMYIIST